MKNKRILISSLALMALAAAAPLYADAATRESIKGKFKFAGAQQNKENFDNHPGRFMMASTTPAEFKEKIDERQTKMEAISEALKENDYAAWVVAAGADNPLAGKITADNFSKISEAYNLMEQAKQKMEESGLDGNDFGLLGGGFGMGFGGGRWHNLEK
ncbi:MAG: hypothetical protein WC415_03420 [Patescibacteria group bacterium]|jgi:hypothetical protein